MGRRALRKTDPSLDLSSYLKTFDDLPKPCNAEALFGRRAPLEVEIGSGKGLFMRLAAAERPDIDFLGIEVAKKYAQFAAAGLAQRELSNAKMVSGDAFVLFRELFPDESIEAVHVYFPDPWWKKRHKRRRVMQESLVRDIRRTLKPGGRLHFWTDVEEYFQTGIEVVKTHTDLDGPLDVAESEAAHDMDYRTHFERRVRLHDEPVYRAEFQKRVASI